MAPRALVTPSSPPCSPAPTTPGQQLGPRSRRSPLWAIAPAAVLQQPGVLRLMLAKRPSAATRQGVREAAAAREAIVARESAMLLLGLGAAPLRSAGRGRGSTRPPLCAVSKAGRVTGAKLSDKAIARLVKQAALDAGLDRDAIPAARCTPAWPPLPGTRVRASPS